MSKVYIYQFESWWSTNLHTWVEWLQRYLKEPFVWSLNDHFKPLCGTPYHAVIATGIDRRSYTTRKASDLLIWMPCDWQQSDYKTALSEALELQQLKQVAS